MTQERLDSLSLEKLCEIAEKEGFKKASDTRDREVLIDYILEAMNDNRIERNIINNPAMKLKGHKYDIFKDEELVSGQKEIFHIPERYNETQIVLLLRDPQWAFAYWDVNDLEAESLRNEMFFEGFFLRVYEQSINESVPENGDQYFDIPISENDGSRYINFLHGGKQYSVNLFVMVHNKEKLLCKSNIVHSPRGYIAENNEEFMKDSDTRKIIFSSLWDYHQNGENLIPQRIIAIMENQQVRLKI